MHKCPTCGKQLGDSVRFCPDDGTPLTETAAALPQRTPTHQRPPTVELVLPVVVGTRYRLVEGRGGGGMARVYRAVDLTLEREVAVKLINQDLRAEPEFDARFHREARIASQLSDPHIVVVHDFGIDTELGPFLVMEYLRGQSLRERLATGGPLPLKAALQLAGQLMLALIHAHDKGIVHRDIKPDNIFLLNQSGVRLHTRVLDFGIARIYRHDEPARQETLTRPGGVIGTPRYMSPEQLAGNPVDARSDLYSAALVIHEALTGQLPYVSGKKLTELCPEATPALQALLDQCLKPNPQERPASAAEVYLRLQELGKASGILLLPPGAMDKLLAARQSQEPTLPYQPKEAPAKPKSRRWLLLLLAGLGAVILLALLAWGIAMLVKATHSQESLLKLKVGDTRDDVIATLGKPARERHGHPWQTTLADRAVIGNVLNPADLGGEDASLDNRDILMYAGDTLGIVLHDDRVEAIMVRARGKAPTGRGVDVGDSEGQLVHAYASELQSVSFFVAVEGSKAETEREAGRPEKRGKIYRYDNLGIGFEVVDEKITAITLYPAKAP